MGSDKVIGILRIVQETLKMDKVFKLKGLETNCVVTKKLCKYVFLSVLLQKKTKLLHHHMSAKWVFCIFALT